MGKLIKRLNWDSSFFRYEVGRYFFNKDSFRKEKFKNEASVYRLVYVYSNEDIDISNFKLVDEKVTFYQKITNKNLLLCKNRKIKTFNVNEYDLNTLIKLGLESGVYSRFKTDDSFSNNEYERLYKEWILNSINNKLSFKVLISVNEHNKILGFITVGELNKQTSEIGLISVSKDARGKGLARELVNSAIIESINRGYESIEVVTQKGNAPAMNLYLNTDFRKKENINIYHYWNL